MQLYRGSAPFLRDELREVSRNRQLTVHFLRADFAVVVVDDDVFSFDDSWTQCRKAVTLTISLWHYCKLT